MRSAISVSVLLLTFSCLYADDPSKVLLWRINYGLSGNFTNTAGLNSFYVDCDRLDRSNCWTETAKFPMNLGAESRRAASLLKSRDKFGSELVLQQVKVKRLELGESPVYKSDIGKHLTNQWFVVFTFSTDAVGKLVSAVALLNGSYADNRVEPQGVSATAFAGSKKNVRRGGAEQLVQQNCYDKLHSTALRVPSIQWDPSTDGNPFTIEDRVNANVEYLRKQYALSSELVYVKQIHFERFVPSEAVTAQGLNLVEHFHHWVCAIEFEVLGDYQKDYTVYSLLDGTILQ